VEDRSQWPFPAMLPYQIIYNYPMPPMLGPVAPPSPDEWPPPMDRGLRLWRDRTAHLVRNELHQIYVHVPFCPFICPFCPFYKVSGSTGRLRDLTERYVTSLLREIALYGKVPAARANRYSVIYFGGGTPTELTPEQLARIVRALRAAFDVAEDAELTIEGVARQMLAPGYLEGCFTAGFNRVSFGVQSLDPAVRRAIGRIGDDVEDYPRAIERARAAGPGVPVNLELMANCPEQTPASFAADLDRVISWRPDSVDVFTYTMVPGTALHRSITGGEKSQPRYGAQMLQMRRLATGKLGAAGYRHVGGEVFARTDRDRFSESFYGGKGNALHAVLGLGPSAIGHLEGTAYRNACDLGAWEDALDRGRLPVGSATVMDRKMGRRKAVLFGLANLHLRAELVETAAERRLLERWERQGLVERGPDGYRLTAEGGLWFNQMQLSLLPLADLAVMMKMVGSYSEQDRMVNGGTPLGDELVALAGSSGGVLGRLTALGYQASLSVMKHLPDGSAAIRWLRR